MNVSSSQGIGKDTLSYCVTMHAFLLGRNEEYEKGKPRNQIGLGLNVWSSMILKYSAEQMALGALISSLCHRITKPEKTS